MCELVYMPTSYTIVKIKGILLTTHIRADIN